MREARTQTLLSLLLLGAVAGTVAGVDLLARDERLADLVAARDLRRFRDGVEYYSHRGNWLEFEDRLLVDEIPGADYSRGGVYFFGSSNLKWAMKTWEIPAEQRPFIGNYGIGAINHALEFQFIRYLVEERGLLQAGGEKTRIVLGAFWSNAVSWDPEAYFGPLWRRHRLYTYSRNDGIHAAAMGPVTRQVRIEKARCSGFIGGNFNRLARLLMTWLGLPIDATERIKDPAEVRAWVLGHYGNMDWRGTLSDQMAALEELLAYLQMRGAGVTVVLLPYRSAFDEIPLTGAYKDEVLALCARRSVEVVDLSHALAEDEYWDMNHFNWQGLGKTHAALMRVAMEHLRGAGIVAAGPVGSRDSTTP